MSIAPHLELEELLAEVSSEAARVHLAACPECQAERERWESVAGGVRQLVAATALPPWQPGQALLGPAERRLSPNAPRPPLAGAQTKRRQVVAAAAAAVVLAVAGVSYGLAGGSGSDGKGGPAIAAGLTAVSGCSGLVAGLGTVQQVNGASLVLKTPGGQPVTVAIAASTAVSREVTGSASDIADGARIFLRGIYAKGKVTAHSVSIGVTAKLPASAFGQLRPARERPWVSAGTVQDAARGSFTLVAPSGTRLPVTVPDTTAVVNLVRSDSSQLQAGDYVVAVGRAGKDGALAASTVEEGTSLPHDRSRGISSLSGTGCAPSTIATAALAAAR
jgi:hypothetical protein